MKGQNAWQNTGQFGICHVCIYPNKEWDYTNRKDVFVDLNKMYQPDFQIHTYLDTILNYILWGYENPNGENMFFFNLF